MPLFVLTVICGLLHIVIQQMLRLNANDPQIQIAEDLASSLSNGKQPVAFNGPDKIDIGKSLAPFIIVYDTKGNPTASNGTLEGSIPKLPSGVFEFATHRGKDIITWQPRHQVRIALVIIPCATGFVAVGRSLREVEARESNFQWMIGLVWGASVFIILMIFFGNRIGKKKQEALTK